MPNIHDQRAIIDRRAVTARLDELAERDSSRTVRRQAVLACFKEALAAGREEIKRRFEAKGNGAMTLHETSFLIDQLVRTAYDFAIAHELAQGVRTSGEAMTLVAVGGYGRGELSPQSDIDLLFLTPYKRAPWHEQLVEWLLYLLWDLGLKVGQATRSAEECIRHAKEDMTIRTALLEMRWLWGDKVLYDDLVKRFQQNVVQGTGQEYFEAKLEERNQRHERMGDVRYVLEPNVKEGKGGLRDLHLLFWLARYQFGVVEFENLVQLQVISADAASRFVKAQNFLWTVRCHLHYLTGREEDRLTFDVQPEIAQRMGYSDRASSRGVERFMKHFYLVAKDVGDLTRLFCSLDEERHKAKLKPSLLARLKRKKSDLIEGFRLDGERLNTPDDQMFEADPIAMIRLFRVALESGLDIHPHALDMVHRNLRRLDAKVRKQPEAMHLFMSILANRRNPEIALRRMNESGVLGRLIPDFGRVVAQMQYDMYHVYTVDEHTIQAVGVLHSIESGELALPLPLATSIFSKIHSRDILYLAVFLHDVAKGRSGDHSVLGAEIATKLGPSLGFNPGETETVAWLVRHHLLMSHTAFKRDIDDPKTISDFVAIVQSPERLRMLLLLTVVDIKAVGPTVWNAWKAGLLRELYLRAEEAMTGDLTQEGQSRGRAGMESLRAGLEKLGWTDKDIKDHLALGYPGYWITFDTDSHLHHAKMIAEAEKTQAKLTVSTRDDPTRGATEITVYTGDHAGLFSQIAGAMALSGVNIVDARIVTLSNGMALDTFWVQNGEGDMVHEERHLTTIKQTIEQVMTGRVWLDKELPAKRSRLPNRAAVFKVPPRVIGDEAASRTHTVIEVNGRDRPGLLYDLTSAMTGQGLQISSAHISTYGERVVDVFYVKDVFGHKVRGQKLEAVRQKLLNALEAKSA